MNFALQGAKDLNRSLELSAGASQMKVAYSLTCLPMARMLCLIICISVCGVAFGKSNSWTSNPQSAVLSLLYFLTKRGKYWSGNIHLAHDLSWKA